MARLLQRYTLPDACAYLPGLESSTDYRLMLDVTPEELDNLLEHGWRRFGPTYFRPVCADCAECVSIRVPVASFHPTKSQRRAAKKCRHLQVRVRAPVVDEEHLALYAEWHAAREEARGWRPNALDEENYKFSFCFPHPCAREMAYYDAGRLVGVGIVDVTPCALSSVYFYYHPDYLKLSLGIASVLFEIEWARQHGCAHVYLGYRVLGCPSVAYKQQFGPHDLLSSRPELDEPAVWTPQELSTDDL